MTDPLAEEDSATALSLPPAAADVAAAAAGAAAAVGVAVAELGVEPPHPENDSANAIAVATRRTVTACTIRIMCKSRLLVSGPGGQISRSARIRSPSKERRKASAFVDVSKRRPVCERREREKMDET